MELKESLNTSQNINPTNVYKNKNDKISNSISKLKFENIEYPSHAQCFLFCFFFFLFKITIIIFSFVSTVIHDITATNFLSST